MRLIRPGERPVMPDVGSRIGLSGSNMSDGIAHVDVTMGIRAPNGDTCFIFDGGRTYPDGKPWSSHHFTDTQCEAVRAFVEQHR